MKWTQFVVHFIQKMFFTFINFHWIPKYFMFTLCNMMTSIWHTAKWDTLRYWCKSNSVMTIKLLYLFCIHCLINIGSIIWHRKLHLNISICIHRNLQAITTYRQLNRCFDIFFSLLFNFRIWFTFNTQIHHYLLIEQIKVDLKTKCLPTKTLDDICITLQ